MNRHSGTHLITSRRVLTRGLYSTETVFSLLRKAQLAGFRVNTEGYRPRKGILESIHNFSIPEDITGIHSWFSLVNQVAYSFMQTESMVPFRELLSYKTTKVWLWEEMMTAIFEGLKEERIREVMEGITSFEKDKPTALFKNWSQTRIGFTLTQQHCSFPGLPTLLCGGGHWKLVYAGSRFTRAPEKRCASIEREALAIVHGLLSCGYFFYGMPKPDNGSRTQTTRRNTQ